MKNPDLRSEIREIALEVLEARGDDSEISRQVEALVGSVDDTLPNELILEELRELQAGGPTFRKVIADNSPNIEDREDRDLHELENEARAAKRGAWGNMYR